ncbi:hypothetical protein [Haloarcula nitratireducens]|uniref:DUF8106 domain-containing protein n=1 Tax=Haloarcula nitratireducens TaxID=2487749 RepID=A0AAW4PAU8_9EURY|nr:hypothetical protein [Halomicroarcula nitratireducens]MBX0294402.1 hypothetical protein [Halomicroarcula nitratireducens]
MTSIETRAVDAADTERPRQRRRKGVLFCPACGHESHVGENWAVDRTGDERALRCPECETVVSDR